MNLKLVLRLTSLLGLLLLMNSCPSNQGAKNGLTAGDLTHRSVRARVTDKNGGAVLDGMCASGSRCQDEIISPTRLNRVTRPSRCSDGNCLKSHIDRTPSRPASSIGDVPGFTPFSEELSWSMTSDFQYRDDSPIGYCGRGVYKILTKHLCLKNKGIVKDDGHRWDNNLANNPNFKEVNCQPTTCPPGTIITYEHENPRPRNPPRGQKGRRFGHVEIVTYSKRGGRQYCSSHCQGKWGGSVRHTKRRAFVYIGGGQCRK